MTRGRATLGAALASLALLSCVHARTVCPAGTGVTRRVFSGGAEAEWCHREDGVRQGPEMRFYESGATMIEGEYLDGVQHGVWRHYLNQGTVWREDRWDDGALVARKIDPRFVHLSPAEMEALAPTQSGVVKLAAADPLLERAAREQPHATFAASYPDGRPRVSGRYDGNGLRTGTWRFWHESGRLAREVDYEGGIRHRAFREWHPSGAPKTDGFYLQGEPSGVWRRWDEAGRRAD